MRVSEEFNVEVEVALLRQSFTETRRNEGEWTPMAVFHGPQGEVVPALVALPDADSVTRALASVIVESKARAVMVCQDAYYNNPERAGGLTPSEDPLAAEVMAVCFVTADDVEVRFYPYRMEDRRVRFTGADLMVSRSGERGSVESRMAPILQRALRYVAAERN